MKIEIISCLKDNYSYLLIDEKKNTACVVDPSEADPIIKYLDQNKINLKFILNTHHHFDHVGGNTKLKKKYKAKVIGYAGDKNRIPEIDILLNDQEIWKQENFEAQIIYVPGHTLGHICFYFFKKKIIFTGDTLFSLGCGRLFEGSYSQMYESLNKIKKLPSDTQIFCGHEYTLANSKFCLTHDSQNEKLKIKILEIKKKRSCNLPTIPSTIKDELECNIFLRAKDIETFSKLRDLKDNF
ncbi:MAG: hydroxyacylglutathione hydrolase [Pelagibacterales bacterium]|nr:hydroxyacylglutathione hydrolase [Pelagibacterales bacterium]